MAKKLSKSAIETVLKGKNSKNTAKLAQELYDILKSGAKVEKDREALTSQQYDRMKTSLDALMVSESTRDENLRMQAELGEEKHLMEETAIDLMKEQLRTLLTLGEAEEGEIFNLKESITARQKTNDELERSIKNQKEAAEASDRVAKGLKKTIGYNDDYKKSMVGSVIEMGVMFDTAEGGFGALGASLRETVDEAGLVFNAMEKVGESLFALAMASIAQMKALDSQQVAFRKTTGLGMEYDQMMSDTYSANKLNGVSVEENAQAMGDLAKVMSDFTMLGAQQKKMLTETAGILQENGVATATFAANTQIMNKGLSMGAEDAAQFNTTMVAMAKDIGMAPQELAEGFGELAGTMSALSGGSEAAQTAMRGLSATSKATGIAMGRIVDITSQFDTFEGASESVGKLNAMLGGDFVNAMDVMAAEDPAERFGMMQQALDDAGKSFDDMAYYEKKAIAESMGLKDTNELAMLMSGNMDQLSGDFGKTSAEIEEMAAQAKLNQDVSESFSQLMSEMAPIFQGLIDVARGFIEILMELGPALKYVGIALGFLGVALTGAYVNLRFLSITGQLTGMSMKALGAASYQAGMKAMLGFVGFIIIAALIYGVYKATGPLTAGLVALGYAAFQMGVKFNLAFLPYVIAATAIYEVYKRLGPFSAALLALGLVAFKTGLLMQAAFWPYVAIAALIYGVYKTLGPLGGGLVLLGIAAIAAGIAMALGFTTATMGLATLIPLVVVIISGLIGVFVGLYKWVKKLASGTGILSGAISILLIPLKLVVFLFKVLWKVIKTIGSAIMTVLAIPFKILSGILYVLTIPLKLVAFLFKGLYKVITTITGAITAVTDRITKFVTKIVNILVPALKVLGVVLLAMSGPVGLLVVGAGLIYKNFGKLKSMFSSLGKAIQEGVTDKFLMLKDIFLAIPKAFKKMGGMLFGGVGWLAGKLGIPGFQDGGTTPGGPVVVGEQGPEIVAPPAGSGVLPNFLTTALADVGNTMGGMLGIGGGGGAPQEINLHVTLELEGRELAKYIKKVALPMMNPVAGKST